ncbi:MAG: hypothetical protein U9N84_05195 [Actinomycetota bacterium]|nr:hypothetical protein [Actinomycetota bacterium]
MLRRGVVPLGFAFLMVVAACGGGTTAAPPATTQTLAVPANVASALAPLPDDTCSLLQGPSCPFDADNFSNPTVITNQWHPLTPGTELVFEGTTNEDNELLEHRVVITVTDLVKVIDGIPSVVAYDQDFSTGELAEKEIAFFAQDDDGNLWRMGEHPEEYDGGRFVEAPTWLAGIGGAKAGIAMLGSPDVGTLSYAQGFSTAVEFMDRAQVQQLEEETCVAYGCFSDVLVIGEFSVEEPGARQLKFFASGIGNIRVDWGGADETQEELELVSFRQLSRAELAEIREAALALEAHAYRISPDVYGLSEPIRTTGGSGSA